ncbi:MAG: hypothetical protein DWQ01_08750 [Planctomycetota bacterium]|nr:MAG: hypothetical protein DWQ01_08750 [Planctomycetota bacterium]
MSYVADFIGQQAEQRSEGSCYSGLVRLASEITATTKGKAMPPQTLERLMNGRHQPAIPTLLRLKAFFGDELDLNRITEGIQQ